MVKEYFGDDDNRYYTCLQKNCFDISQQEQDRQKKLSHKFKHSWLTDDSLTLCTETGIHFLSLWRAVGCSVCCVGNTIPRPNFSKLLLSTLRLVRDTRRMPNMIQLVPAMQSVPPIKLQYLQSYYQELHHFTLKKKAWPKQQMK